MKFKNLGLLVIDEEQHFGVGHKERLKELRSDVHVLTLTATPIPRTLQLALSGVRELSLIATPPVDRLAIRTYVSEFDPVTVREALLREHYRGGQSFYVVPRIADLPEVEDFLREQVPEVKFVVAHGQMAASELDERMNAFYDGALRRAGLDDHRRIRPRHPGRQHADRRARRHVRPRPALPDPRPRRAEPKLRAYAFLTTEPRKKLTPQAEKRLRVLGALDIARRRLHAGQPGPRHPRRRQPPRRGAVGPGPRGRLRTLPGDAAGGDRQAPVRRHRALADDGEWSPQINLGVPVLIPEAYVPDLDVRLGLYRRLSSLEKKVELEGFAAELIDRFGPLPSEVDTLMLIVRIKALCKRAGIAKLDGGPKGATVQFHDDKYANPAGLVQFLNDQRGLGEDQGQPHRHPPRLARREGPAGRRLPGRPGPRRPRQGEGGLSLGLCGSSGAGGSGVAVGLVVNWLTAQDPLISLARPPGAAKPRARRAVNVPADGGSQPAVRVPATAPARGGLRLRQPRAYASVRLPGSRSRS